MLEPFSFLEFHTFLHIHNTGPIPAGGLERTQEPPDTEVLAQDALSNAPHETGKPAWNLRLPVLQGSLERVYVPDLTQKLFGRAA